MGLPFFLFPSPLRTVVFLLVPLSLGIALLAGRSILPRTPYNIPMFFLSVMILVSCIVTYDLEISLSKISGLLLGIWVFYLVWRKASTYKKWVIHLGVFLLAGTLFIFIGLLGTSWLEQKSAALSILIPFIPKVISGLPGAPKGFHPNELAGIILWFLPLSLTVMISLFYNLRRYASHFPKSALVILGIGMIGLNIFVAFVLFLTQSRTAMLALLSSFLLIFCFVLFIRKRYVLFSLTLIVALIGGVIVLLKVYDSAALNPAFIDPALSLQTFNGRIELWKRAAYAIGDFPITGMGLNTFRYVVFARYPLFTVSDDFDLGHAHNLYLQTALDLGIPGLIAFLAMIGITFSLFWKMRSCIAPLHKGLQEDIWHASLFFLIAGLSWSFTAFLLYGLVDAIALGARPGVLLWFLFGLIASLYNLVKERKVISGL